MSLNPEKLNCVAVYDPRLEITNTRDYAVMKGAQSVLYKQYATTSISNSSLTFSCPPPSGSIVVDRKVMLYCPVRLTLTGIPPAGIPLLNPERDSPRAYGLMKSLQTMICTINNQTVSINMADIIGPLLQYNVDSDLEMGQYSTSPTCQDQYQEYTSGFQNTRNSMGLYGDSSPESVTGNAGFANFKIIANPLGDGASVVTAMVDIAFCEHLYISPFVWGKRNSGGLYNVTALDFTFNFLSGANGCRFWSHSSAASGPIISSSFTVGGQSNGPASFKDTSGNAPLMFFQYLTPNQSQIVGPQTSIPYALFDVQEYQTNVPTTIAGDSFTAISNNIQLSSIPRRIYLWIRQQNQDFYSNGTAAPAGSAPGGCNVPDAYFQIQSINVQYQNQSGLLNSANQIQLFEICKKNHYQGSYTQWSGGPVYNDDPWGANAGLGTQVGTIGSIICLQFADDIGLQDVLDAPGKLSASTLQIQVSAKNISNRTITPTLFIVTVNEGVFQIESLNRATQSIGVLTSQDILNAMKNNRISYYDCQDVNGGDFWSGVKDAFNKVHNWIKDNKLVSKGLTAVGHYLPEALPLTVPASMVAEHYGYGNDNEAGVLLGSGRRGRRGGAQMSHKSLAQRAHNY